MTEARPRLFTPLFFVMCGFSFTVFVSAFMLLPTAPFHILDLGGSTTQAPQPVVDAVFAAKEGELLGPVKAVDGWYLVLVEKRVPAPTFEECSARVKDDLVARTVAKWRIGLRSDPDVKIAPDL